MDCPYIPELKYSDFGQRLRERIAEKRVPLSGSMELTFQCNLRCKHCYLDEVHNGIPGQQELSTEEWYDLLDQMADLGTLWLLMTGGEPFVRPDFLEIYTYAKRKGFLITIFTNGTLITPEIADYLAEWRPSKIEITLYGATEQTYELVTGVRGSFSRCKAGIERLLERQIPLRLKTVVTKLNQHELWQMKTYADSLETSFRYDAMLNAGINGGNEPKVQRLSPEEIVQLDLDDPDRLAAWYEYTDRMHDVRIEDDYLYHCGAGIRTYHIDPYGLLSICLLSREPQLNLRTKNLSYGWHIFLKQVRTTRRRLKSKCSQCSLVTLCGNCPAWAYMEQGNPEVPTDFQCSVTYLRAQALGILNEGKETNNVKAECGAKVI